MRPVSQQLMLKCYLCWSSTWFCYFAIAKVKIIMNRLPGKNEALLL